ncbi:uncharacterized protein LOC129581239 isoform X2 [Paramacrobiotus metropolitanus]|uniref:uncharacterized protein LOC129581239 isoform X2 n=1 Tax=Paramacrobiotus metropolitanus TaxID=2943436 RepID=UPI0024465AB2|nr:uncharacterized protein LOC129581239 isoform X2 [Paramacrobiotus metropolitanus]
MDVLPSPSLDVMSTLAPPALRESSRKRVRKTLGPDFVDFSGPVRFRAQAVVLSDEATVRKVTPKRLILSDSKLPKRDGAKRNGFKKRRSAKSQRKALAVPAAIIPIAPDTGAEHTTDLADIDAFCNVCGLRVHKLLRNGFRGGDSEGLAVRCTGERCNYTGHVSCLPNTADIKSFRCADCAKKQCVVCEKGNVSTQPDDMVRCCRCKKAFHLDCHVPPVDRRKRKSPAGILRPWCCKTCRTIRRRIKKPSRVKPASPQASHPTLVPCLTTHSDLPDHSYALPSNPPLLSPALVGPTLYRPHAELVDAFSATKTSGMDNSGEDDNADKGEASDAALVPLLMPGQPFDPILVPDSMIIFGKTTEKVRERIERDRELRQDLAWWSVEQCAAYFQDSDPDLAQLIIDHELLGCALLLITRSQFLDLFQLPVGKALRMHAAVCRCRRMYF